MSARKRQLTTAQVIKNGEGIFHNLRWKYGIVVCPYCGSIHIKEYDGYRYKCNSCKNRFSDRTNTLMHNSKLSVGIWMLALYEMFTNNFVSSTSLAVKLGINQKSAWLIQSKMRMAMCQDDIKLSGVIAQDEMYIGGCLSNYHYGRKLELLRRNKYIKEGDTRYSKQAIFALNSALKAPVFGMTDGDKVVLYNTPNPIKKEYIRKLYRRHCGKGNIVVSDESGLYQDWEKATGSKLYTNNHHNNQYITSNGLTSNAIENRFSWFKRGFNGTITHCVYTQLYLNEFAFRYNTRKLSTTDRFKAAVEVTIGTHMTYQQIRDYEPLNAFISKTKRRAMAKKEKQSMKAIESLFKSGLITTELHYKNKVYTPEDFK